jgi:hypothetical protein
MKGVNPMHLRIGLRVCGMTAALLGTTLGVAAPSQAADASPKAEAYVVSAQALGGLAQVLPTPDSKFPPGGTVTVVGLHVGSIATDATLTATTAGDAKAGTSSASATGDRLTLTVPQVGTLDVTGIKATCDAPAGPGTATGSGIIATATFTPTGGVAIPITIAPGVNTTVSAAGLGSIVFDKQSTDKDGNLTVEAADVTLAGGQEVVIGYAMCGGAAPSSGSAQVHHVS